MRPAKRIGKLTTTRATATTTDEGTNAKVLAAGTLPWRIKSGQLQVLLIHRPRPTIGRGPREPVECQ